MDERIRALLPVGSIVKIKEPSMALMISGILREVRNEENGASLVYDYEGVLYPCGYLDENSTYLFSADDIAEVIHRGYEDEERDRAMKMLLEYAANEPAEGGPRQ